MKFLSWFSTFGSTLAVALALTACDDSTSPNGNENPSSSSVSEIKDSSDTGATTNSSSSEGFSSNNNSSESINNGESEGNLDPFGLSSSGSASNENKNDLPKGYEYGTKSFYNITRNEVEQTFTIAPASQGNMGCLVESNNVKWTTLPSGSSGLSVTLKYEFHGDTLIMYEDRGDDNFYTNGAMYIGGKSGQLDGNWIFKCLYDSQQGKTDCATEDQEYLFKISGSNVTVIQKTESAESSDFDYARSDFRRLLFSELNDRRRYFTVPPLYTLLLTTTSTKTYDNIYSESLTKTEETFWLAGKSYTVKISSYEQDPDGQKVSILISDSERACSGSYETTINITEKLCTQRNLQYLFYYSDEVIDIDGHTYNLIDSFEKGNDEEFSDCLKSLIEL